MLVHSHSTSCIPQMNILHVSLRRLCSRSSSLMSPTRRSSRWVVRISATGSTVLIKTSCLFLITQIPQKSIHPSNFHTYLFLHSVSWVGGIIGGFCWSFSQLPCCQFTLQWWFLECGRKPKKTHSGEHRSSTKLPKETPGIQPTAFLMWRGSLTAWCCITFIKTDIQIDR